MIEAPTVLVERALPDTPIPKVEVVPVEKPHKFSKKIYLTGIALLGAAQTADAITTRHLLNEPGTLGAKSDLRQTPVGGEIGCDQLGFFAAEATTFYFTEHSKRGWVRWLGRTFIAAQIANGAKLAACNISIDGNSPNIQACHAITPGY